MDKKTNRKYTIYEMVQSAQHDLCAIRNIRPKISCDQIIDNNQELTEKQKTENIHIRLESAIACCCKALNEITEELFGKFGEE